MRLAGRHAIVTGGGTGIGAAIASALEAEGAVVSRIGRERARLGRNGFAADVTVRAQVDAAFAAARAANGPISILIANAGAAKAKRFGTMDEGLWNAMLSVNLDGVFHCCQAALPDLLAAEAGRILMVASTAGLRGYAFTSAYCAAKHGAIGLMRALALEFGETGLKVNAVCPGFTDTDLVAEAAAHGALRRGGSVDDARAALARQNPSGRLIAPEEVAALALSLCLSNRTGEAVEIS